MTNGVRKYKSVCVSYKHEPETVMDLRAEPSLNLLQLVGAGFSSSSSSVRGVTTTHQETLTCSSILLETEYGARPGFGPTAGGWWKGDVNYNEISTSFGQKKD